jgi:MFS family permease
VGWRERDGDGRVKRGRSLAVGRTTLFSYAVYLMLGWSSVLVPALIVSIEHSFGRSDSDIGVVYLVGALLYAGGALGGGFLAERFGARLMLMAALVALGLGLVVQGWSAAWPLFVVAAAIGQCGSGAADGGVQAVILELYPQNRGGVLNLLHLFYGVGALVGPAAVGIVVTTGMNWRVTFFGSGVFVLLLSILVTALPQARDAVAPTLQVRDDRRVPSARERSLVAFFWLAVSIACYEAATIGVANWLVRYMSDGSVGLATATLSLFWGGICGVRLVAPWLTKRWSSVGLAVGCILCGSLALGAAVVVQWTPAVVGLFALTGVFVGPIYPLIIAIGGDLYPRRLPLLSGGLTTAATLGAIIYPPLMGFVADWVGIRIGLIGAAVLGIPAALALLAATRSHVSQRFAASR